MKKNLKTTNKNYLYLFIFVLLSYIFYYKNIYIAPNLVISVSLLVYPFVFLINANNTKSFGTLNTKKMITSTTIGLLLFILLSSILCSFESILDTNIFSTNLRDILAPNNLSLGNFIIYYPNLYFTFLFIIFYTITNIVFSVIYEAITDNSNFIIGFLLSYLIIFLLDRILFIPLINIGDIINNSLSLINLIKILTANFIIVIFSSIILLFIHYLIKKRK